MRSPTYVAICRTKTTYKITIIFISALLTIIVIRMRTVSLMITLFIFMLTPAIAITDVTMVTLTIISAPHIIIIVITTVIVIIIILAIIHKIMSTCAITIIIQ